jgi:phage-related minor tail protein
MWINLKKKVKTAMPLEIWLHREDTVEKPTERESASSDSKTASLRDAETALPEFKADDSEEANPMDAFSDMRAAKRQRAMDEAKSGMQQVAQERETAEREDSARKLEAANAEAEALKAQANKIAAVEKEAIEQSKNTWGSRIKNIIGATVSAAGGAFFGGIGARAGEEAVNAVFSDGHR